MRRDGHREGRCARRPQDVELGSHFTKDKAHIEQGITNDEVFLWVGSAVFMLGTRIEGRSSLLDAQSLQSPSTFCGSLFDIRYSFFNISQHIRGDVADTGTPRPLTTIQRE